MEKELTKKLIFFIKKLDYVTCEKLIKSGADVNKKSVEFLPLYLAISNNDFNITKLLIENGANVDAPYKSSETIRTRFPDNSEYVEYRTFVNLQQYSFFMCNIDIIKILFEKSLYMKDHISYLIINNKEDVLKEVIDLFLENKYKDTTLEEIMEQISKYKIKKDIIKLLIIKGIREFPEKYKKYNDIVREYPNIMKILYSRYYNNGLFALLPIEIIRIIYKKMLGF